MNGFPWVGLIEGAGVLQLAVAILNLFLVPLFKWQAELGRVPLLLREVFQVHAWFISVTLLIFGVISLRFAGELAAGTDVLGRWLAAGIGGFWGLRSLMQVGYYSSCHWRGRPARTVAHIVLLLLYGSLAGIYLSAGLKF